MRCGVNEASRWNGCAYEGKGRRRTINSATTVVVILEYFRAKLGEHRYPFMFCCSTVRLHADCKVVKTQLNRKWSSLLHNLTTFKLGVRAGGQAGEKRGLARAELRTGKRRARAAAESLIV